MSPRSVTSPALLLLTRWQTLFLAGDRTHVSCERCSTGEVGHVYDRTPRASGAPQAKVGHVYDRTSRASVAPQAKSRSRCNLGASKTVRLRPPYSKPSHIKNARPHESRRRHRRLRSLRHDARKTACGPAFRAAGRADGSRRREPHHRQRRQFGRRRSHRLRPARPLSSTLPCCRQTNPVDLYFNLIKKSRHPLDSSKFYDSMVDLAVEITIYT